MKKKLAISLLALASSGASGATLISEFAPNPAGGDPATVDFEITGDANSAFDLWVISMDTDFGPGNTVDRATNVTGTFDAAGFANVSVPDFENPSFTVALVDTFTGATGDILDSPDDLTTLGISTVFDAITISDSTADLANSVIGALGTGFDLPYTGDEPGLVFRDGTTGLWRALNEPFGGDVYLEDGTTAPDTAFDSAPTLAGTFGSVNPSYTIPEPSVSFLGAFALLGLLRRRR